MSSAARTGTTSPGNLYKTAQPIQARTVGRPSSHGIAYATEDRKRYGLNLLDDIKRNISGSALGKLAKWGRVDANSERVVANRFRKSMRIKAPNVAVITGKLSGGNQQKVVLSKWLFADPDVLILDEPTRGIDVGAKYEIYTIINEMAAQGKAIVVISSELPELLGICDRIYALSAGRITGEVDTNEAHPEKLMQYMTEGEGVPQMSSATGRRRRSRRRRTTETTRPSPASRNAASTGSRGNVLQLPERPASADRHLHRADRDCDLVPGADRRHAC